MWLVLHGCTADRPDVEAYASALRTGACETVRDRGLRDDCWVALAERDGTDRCGEVDDARMRDECAFQLAEHAGEASLCGRAGRFADDCRLHVLSGRLRTTARGASPGEKEDEVAALVEGAGLAPSDLRPWTAWYREVLARQAPLDRSACATIAVPERAEACRRTGLHLYGDRLNHARDTGRYPCDGSPLPRELVTAPDPEIEALRAARTDLCPR